MSLAIILGTLSVLLAPVAGPSGVQQQTAQSQESSQAGSASQQPQTQPAKPCPATPGASVEKPPNCTPTHPSKRKKHHHAPPADGSGKTVVRNGGTSDPIVAIAPSENDQQASQQLNATNQLLGSAESNLKQMAGWQLNSDQQGTVNQIKSYMQQAKTAEQNGEVERAYNLANKANLLAADLLGKPQ